MSAAEPSAAYDPDAIEPRWQARWRDERAFMARDDLPRDRRFCLVEAQLAPEAEPTLGDLRARVVADAIARHRRQRGIAVLRPLAWASFGAPAGRAASARGVDPRALVADAIARRRAQLERLGLGYAWSRSFAASDPARAAREQELLLELVEAGLMYRMSAPATWSTGLASIIGDDEVRDGRCAITGTPVERRELAQWFVRVSKHAHELPADAARLRDWAISRQSAWGNPIPFVYGEHAGFVPLRRQDLPVTPPSDATMPLAQHPTWPFTAADGSPLTVRTAHGAEPARRETDTLDPAFTAAWSCAAFACGDAPLARERADRWLPAELLVVPADRADAFVPRARALQRALCDLGYASAREPFREVLRVGAVRGDGDVAALVARHGADAVRLSLLAGVPVEAVQPWTEDSVVEWRRFLDGLWSSLQADRAALADARIDERLGDDPSAEDARILGTVAVRLSPYAHRAVDSRALAGVIDEYREVAASLTTARSPSVRKRCVASLLRVLAPFAPHIAAQLWHDIIGGDIGSAGWPGDEEGDA